LGDYHPFPDEQAAEESISDTLTNRELDILMMLDERLTNKEIAERLFISPITVKTHSANIHRKMNVRARRQAVAATCTGCALMLFRMGTKGLASTTACIIKGREAAHPLSQYFGYRNV